jgi:hypothetical protein
MMLRKFAMLGGVLVVACGDGDDAAPVPDAAVTVPDAGAGGLLTPPPPEQGFQVVLEPFAVEPGQEAYHCYRLPFPVGGEVDVERIESRFSTGAHHLLISTIDRAYAPGHGPCSASDFGFEVGLGDGVSANLRFLSGAQTPYAQDPTAELALEPGMAFRIREGATLLLQIHWFNAGDATQEAATALNFWYPTETPTRLLEAFFFYHTAISLPAHAVTEVTGRCLFPMDAEVVGMVSHMHARGVDFTTHAVRGGALGEQVYQESSWQEPTMKMWPASGLLDMALGEGLEYRCSFDNQTDATISEGDGAADEMCMLIGLYAGGTGTIFGFPGTAFPSNPCQ